MFGIERCGLTVSGGMNTVTVDVGEKVSEGLRGCVGDGNSPDTLLLYVRLYQFSP